MTSPLIGMRLGPQQRQSPTDYRDKIANNPDQPAIFGTNLQPTLFLGTIF